MLDRSAYLASIGSNAATLILDASLSPDRPVPTCPGWSVEKLLRHVAGLATWVAALTDGAPDDVPYGDLPVPPKGHDLLAFAEAAFANVIQALDRADLDGVVQSWAGPVTPIWWCRRLAIELAIHRVDGQITASGSRSAGTIDTALAIDAIDELFEVFVPLRFDHDAFGTGSVHLHATDSDGEWLVRVEGAAGVDSRVTVSREHAKGDAAARGPASDLLLVLWRRLPTDAVDVLGDASLFDRLVAAATG